MAHPAKSFANALPADHLYLIEDGRIISIRKASVPDEEARIYRMLGINVNTAYKPRRTQLKK
jgi:hypothetical protein